MPGRRRLPAVIPAKRRHPLAITTTGVAKHSPESLCGGEGVRGAGGLDGPGDGELGGGEGDGLVAGVGCLLGDGCRIGVADTAFCAGVREAGSRGELGDAEGSGFLIRIGATDCGWEPEPAALLGRGVIGSSRRTGGAAGAMALRGLTPFGASGGCRSVE